MFGSSRGLLSKFDGKINEKDLSSAGNPVMSNMLHTIWSVDHYPGYLQKQDDTYLEYLQIHFGKMVSEIQQARERKKTFEELCSKKEAIYSELVHGGYEQVFQPNLLNSLQISGDSVSGVQPGKLGRIVNEEANSIFTFPLLKPEICRKIAEEAMHFQRSVRPDISTGAPSRNVLLDYMGYGALKEMIYNVTKSVSSFLFSEFEIDSCYSFIVEYGAGEPSLRSKLDRHTDDSEITVNIPLIIDYEGGELLLHGIRNGSDENEQLLKWRPECSGVAMIHRGQQWLQGFFDYLVEEFKISREALSLLLDPWPRTLHQWRRI